MHRAESIMVAVLAKVTGLTTTGANVSRGRAYPVDGDAVPALTLEMGADEIVGDGVKNMANIDRLLNIRVIAHVKTTGQFDTTLNTIREEVHIALMTDRTQGLSAYVIDTIPGVAEDPELDVADKKIGRQVNNYIIRYRHSVTNPGA